MRHPHTLILRLLILSIVFLPAAAFGQALADHVPADAIVYIGWNGSQSMGPGYAELKPARLPG